MWPKTICWYVNYTAPPADFEIVRKHSSRAVVGVLSKRWEREEKFVLRQSNCHFCCSKLCQITHPQSVICLCQKTTETEVMNSNTGLFTELYQQRSPDVSWQIKRTLSTVLLLLPIRPEVWYWPVERETIAEVAIVSVVLEHLQCYSPVVWSELLTPVSEQRRIWEWCVCLTVLSPPWSL